MYYDLLLYLYRQKASHTTIVAHFTQKVNSYKRFVYRKQENPLASEELCSI